MEEKKAHQQVPQGHENLWTATTLPISFRALSKNADCDVVIVGGGITGISIAYNLSKSGKKVVVIEKESVGFGETSHTTAHLVNVLDRKYYELEESFGPEATRTIAESHSSAIRFIENVIKEEAIGCHFTRVNGYLFLHPSNENTTLDKELQAAFNAGLDVRKLPSLPGFQHFDGPCLEFKNQAKFHPLHYLKGLCEAAIRNGTEIYTHTHSKDIDKKGVVTDEGYKISAKYIVVATDTPVNKEVAVHLNQTAYRTYVIGATVKKGMIPEALWWDTGDTEVNKEAPPYHYIRTEPFNDYFDLLIIGGEDHATGRAEEDVIPEENRYEILETWARRYFDIGTVIYRWSGQVLEPLDGLAYIGNNSRDADNIYFATGFSGNGMTYGTIAGMLIPDLIDGKENAWSNIYDPSRINILKTGKTFFNELLGSIRKHFETDSTPSGEPFLEGLKAGEGKLIVLEGKKYGCYCDEADNLHMVNAACTHLKCTVNWNNDEKSWDCPCHGSRFTYEGHVLHGPANKNLEYHKEHLPTHLER